MNAEPSAGEKAPASEVHNVSNMTLAKTGLGLLNLRKTNHHPIIIMLIRIVCVAFCTILLHEGAPDEHRPKGSRLIAASHSLSNFCQEIGQIRPLKHSERKSRN